MARKPVINVAKTAVEHSSTSTIEQSRNIVVIVILKSGTGRDMTFEERIRARDDPDLLLVSISSNTLSQIFFRFV